MDDRNRQGTLWEVEDQSESLAPKAPQSSTYHQENYQKSIDVVDTATGVELQEESTGRFLTLDRPLTLYGFAKAVRATVEFVLSRGKSG